MDKVYTLEQVAEILQVSAQTVVAEIKNGRLRSKRIGKQYRISETLLMNYINDADAEHITAVEVAVVDETAVEVVMDKVDVKSAIVEPLEMAIKLKTDGLNNIQIADELNNIGLLTAKGKEWNNKYVSKLIMNAEKALREQG